MWIDFHFAVLILLSSIVLDADCCFSRMVHKDAKTNPRELHMAVLSSLPKAEFLTTITVHNATEPTTTDEPEPPTSDPPDFTTETIESNGDLSRLGQVQLLRETEDDENDGDYQLEIVPIRYDFFEQIFAIKCAPSFDAGFCLNGGRCFNYLIANSSLLVCECASGFFGERCEEKYALMDDHSSATFTLGAHMSFLHQKRFITRFARFELAPLFIMLIAATIVYIIALKLFIFAAKRIFGSDIAGQHGSPSSIPYSFWTRRLPSHAC